MVAVHEPTRVEVPRPPGRSSALRFTIAMLAFLPPLTQIAYLIVKDREAWPYLFADDGYYYLAVAHNIGSGAGSTFTGLTETNGYHPLWELMLAGVAVFVRDPYLFVAAVVVLQGLLWLYLVRTALAVGRLVGSEEAATMGVAAMGLLAVITGQLSFSGMESAPLLVIILVAIRRVLEIRDDDPRSEWVLGGVFALIFLTRLDAVLTIFPIAVLVAFRGRTMFGTAVRRGFRLLTPVAAVLCIYVVVNLVVFGTATPVSGQAKSLGSPFWNTKPVEQFLQAGQVGEEPLWLGALALGLSALAVLLHDWTATPARRRLLWCLSALMLGQVLHLAYLVVATSYQVWAWYYYGIALTLFCSTTLVGVGLISRLRSPGAWICLTIGAAFAIVQVPAAFFSGLSHTPRATATVEFITTELPADAVLAMGDRAGLIGYLGDRPMLQLEGLMADAEWLEDLEDGTALDRMRHEDVDYYVWSGNVPSRPAGIDGRDCIILREPRAGGGPKFDVTVCDEDLVFRTGSGHDQFSIWQFDPELNG